LEDGRVEIGMKIKRFVASDMRQAMQRVRDEQGPDAVILSSRRTDEGIEIIAAIDYDESLIREAALQAGGDGRLEVEPARPVLAPHPEPVRAAANPPRPMPTSARPLPSVAAIAAAAMPPAPVATPAPAPVVAARGNGPFGQAAGVAAMLPTAPAPTPAPAPELDGMKRELADLRDMLESQFSSLAWNDLGRRNPMRARMLREFTRMGLDSDIAGEIVAQLPAELTAAQSRYLPMGLLADRLLINDEEQIDQGGMIALVGPTGVGKTTTLAKLAARYVLRNGPRQVALVTTDDFRIGAEEQLFHYGRLLGIPVYAASGAKEVADLLARLSDHRLVLIDTPGLCHGDPRMQALGDALLHVQVPVATSLVLAANSQSGSLDQAVRAYARFRPSGCVLTKIDEASVLGGALSVAIRHGLRIDYTTDGQRVPEDIARPEAHRLVCRAVRMLTGGAPADDSLMADRFGKLALSFA
jgi:flagellar biosynthesis protein FlhF